MNVIYMAWRKQPFIMYVIPAPPAQYSESILQRILWDYVMEINEVFMLSIAIAHQGKYTGRQGQ
jgi:hypothetical protein